MAGGAPLYSAELEADLKDVWDALRGEFDIACRRKKDAFWCKVRQRFGPLFGAHQLINNLI
jgi:hypothetical protein